MSILFLLKQTASWSYFEYSDIILSNFIDPKISRNMVAGTHAVGALILSGGCLLLDGKEFESLYTLAKLFSTGYFLFDTHYILRNEQLTVTRCAWLYHHIATIYYIHQDPIIYGGHKVLFWGELSNIPSYFVYYYLQLKLTYSYKFKIWSTLQKVLYTGIRLPVMAKLAMETYGKATNIKPLALIMPIYAMGIIWTYKLLNQR